MYKILVCASLVLCGLSLSPDAEASGYAYVCSVQHTAYNGPYGQDGYVYTTYYSKPHCNGNMVDYAYYCTPGEYVGNCDDTYNYSLVALLSLKESLHKAAFDGTLVFESTGTIGSGRWVAFYGDK